MQQHVQVQQHGRFSTASIYYRVDLVMQVLSTACKLARLQAPIEDANDPLSSTVNRDLATTRVYRNPPQVLSQVTRQYEQLASRKHPNFGSQSIYLLNRKSKVYS